MNADSNETDITAKPTTEPNTHADLAARVLRLENVVQEQRQLIDGLTAQLARRKSSGGRKKKRDEFDMPPSEEQPAIDEAYSSEESAKTEALLNEPYRKFRESMAPADRARLDAFWKNRKLEEEREKMRLLSDSSATAESYDLSSPDVWERFAHIPVFPSFAKDRESMKSAPNPKGSVKAESGDPQEDQNLPIV